jgi:hypothetical protein
MHPHLDMPPDGNGRSLGERLRALPTERTPPFDWTELEHRARLRTPRPGTSERSRAPRKALLLAATLAALAAAVVLGTRLIRSTGGPADPARAAHGSVALVRPLPGAVEQGPDPEPLMQRAAAAERWLATEPDDQTIVRVSTHLVVTDLEDRIASVDDLLNAERLRNAHAQVHALQLERAQLVDSLAQVRYAELLTTEPP